MSSILFAMAVLTIYLVGGIAFNYDRLMDIGMLTWANNWAGLLTSWYGMVILLIGLAASLVHRYTTKKIYVFCGKLLLTGSLFFMYGAMPFAFVISYIDAIRNIQVMCYIGICLAVFTYLMARTNAITICDTLAEKYKDNNKSVDDIWEEIHTLQ